MQNGTVELDDHQEGTFEILSYAEEEAKKFSKDLGLPPLLEARRQEWRMIDKVFARQAAYDRILVYQIEEFEGETIGKIVRPASTREAMRYRAARGVVVSAGLHALDVLRSNGMDLGHVVNYIANCPYRLEVDFVAGKAVEVLVMNVGDIVGSEDLAATVRAGVVKISRREKQHVLVDEDGTEWDPILPWTPDDQP